MKVRKIGKNPVKIIVDHDGFEREIHILLRDDGKPCIAIKGSDGIYRPIPIYLAGQAIQDWYSSMDEEIQSMYPCKTYV